MCFSLHFNLIPTVFIYQLFAVANCKPLQGHNICPSNRGEFPFIASLGLKARTFLGPRVHHCTGVLISDKHILTAEHCLDNKEPSDFDVAVGRIDLRTAFHTYNVSSWITFNNWARERNKYIKYKTNDIAVITLSIRVNQQDIEPVSLTDMRNDDLPGKNAVIAGWGTTNEGRVSDILQKANLKILTRHDCEKRLKSITKRELSVQRSYLCTAADPYVLIGCGDSGGPLLDENKRLIGITRGVCPGGYWGPLTMRFVNKNQINIHPSVDYYREFITDAANISSNMEPNDVMYDY